jgi:outer membrane protein insertion porin family
VVLLVVELAMPRGAALAQEDAQQAAEPEQSVPAPPEASVPSPTPLTVTEIRVRGSENVDALVESLFAQRTYFQTRVGDEASQEALTNDISRIYTDYGPFADIQVDVTPSERGLRVVFLLTEYPRVRGDLELAGNKELSYRKLKKHLSLKDAARFSDYELWKVRQAILDEYRKAGFYFASVEPKVESVEGESAVRVRLEISEGERVRVEAVRFEGNALVSDKELQRAMRTRRGKRFNDTDLEQDKSALLDLYHDRGMLNARIVRATADAGASGTGMVVLVAVEEGPQFLFEGYDIQITDEHPQLSVAKVRRELRLARGDIFKKTTYIEDIERIRDLYGNRGNILADVRDELLTDTEQEVVRAAVTITEGSTILINDVRIQGLTKTKEYVIRRELERLDLEPGKPIRAENLRKAHQNIVQLGSFIQGLEFVPVSTTDPREKDLVVDLRENVRTGLFTIGGGYGSESGVFGVAEIGEANLLGRAYRLNVRAEIGQRQRRIGQVGFSTPWVLGTPTSMSAQIYSINLRRGLYAYGDYRSNLADNSYEDLRKGVSVTLSTPVTRDIRAFTTIRDESVEASYRPLVEEEDNSSFLIGARETRSVTAGVTRDTRRYRSSLFDPNGGGEDTVSFEHSGGVLGGRNAFRKYTVESSRFFDTWRQLVLALHFRAGYLQDRSGVDPRYLFYERYWLGGIDTVRGFPDYSLLPDRTATITLNGVPVPVRPGIGGNKMFHVNAEYRIPINQMLRGLAFLDVGQVWNEATTNVLRGLDPQIGVGVGVRLEMIPGFLIRLEYGIPLTSLPYYDPTTKRVERATVNPRLHFSMGPSF